MDFHTQFPHTEPLDYMNHIHYSTHTCTVSIWNTWLRSASKDTLCIHKPCSTGHQTGFFVRNNCVRTRQEISKHIFIAICCIRLCILYLLYKLSVNHYTRIQVSLLMYILLRGQELQNLEFYKTPLTQTETNNIRGDINTLRSLTHHK